MLTDSCSLLPVANSQFTAGNLFQVAHCSCSLLVAHCYLLTAVRSLLMAYCDLPNASRCSCLLLLYMLTAKSSLPAASSLLVTHPQQLFTAKVGQAVTLHPSHNHEPQTTKTNKHSFNNAINYTHNSELVVAVRAKPPRVHQDSAVHQRASCDGHPCRRVLDELRVREHYWEGEAGCLVSAIPAGGVGS